MSNNKPFDPELISIDHLDTTGELPVDGLLDAMERGEKKERTFTLAEALEIAKYFEDRGMDIMAKSGWGDFSNTKDVNTYFKEKFNIDLNK